VVNRKQIWASWAVAALVGLAQKVTTESSVADPVATAVFTAAPVALKLHPSVCRRSNDVVDVSWVSGPHVPVPVMPVGHALES
jgi:hypothetical protein